MAEVMRIQRALARAGVASRRGAEELVAAGRVRINGQIAKTGQSVDTESDEITVDGKPLTTPTGFFWIVLNKPPGVLTTKADPHGRRTVFTTDGEAAHKLTHPSTEVERTYRVTVRGDGAAAVRAARTGVQLEDGWVKPLDIRARNIGRGLWELEIVISEGRTREIRRLCEALGLGIERLIRIQFGPVKLGDLPPGATRALTGRERDIIAAIVQ